VITVLLCAGYATRMYPLTQDFPKPLLPVAGKPVLDYFLAQLMDIEGEHAVHVVTNARFATHFKAWRKGWMKRQASKFTEITIHNDGSTDNDNRLGACRDMAWVFERIPKFTHALVAAGDNIFRFSLASLWKAFVAGDSHRIVVLPESEPEKLKQTGVPQFGTDDRVLRLYEKPEHPPSDWSCPAIYFFQGSAGPILSRFLQTSGNKDAPGHFIDFLCQSSTVCAFKVRSSRFDIGSIDDYHKADQCLRKEPVFMLRPG